MSVISIEQAEQMNRLVRERIDSRLFLTCNYAPTDVPAYSDSAQFYLGIQDLYKFVADTSCIISNMRKYAPFDMDKKFIDSFQAQINDIQKMRAVIDHSQSVANGFFARLHLSCYDSIIQAALSKYGDKDNVRDDTEGRIKLWPEDDKDFELLYADLEDRADRLLKDLELFINQVAVSDQREDIVARWIEDILDWYSKKRDVYLGQLGDVYQAKMAQKQGTFNGGKTANRGESAANLDEPRMRGKLNRWIENALFADLDIRLSGFDFIINKSKNQKDIEEYKKQREKCNQDRLEREKQIGENCRDYFFNNLKQQLKETMEIYSGGLLPQELLQADIKRVFEDVRSQDFS